MGNYSRNPELRLADALTKHYVGHRVEQGVPLLDADLHLVDGLHRSELEGVGRWMLGDGVPVGSDGFRVLALAGGGVNTIVLRATTVGTGPSSIAVDVAVSTAAAALGFSAQHAAASRFGDSPAQLTSERAQPFVLAAGQTLVVSVDGGAPETVTFQPADFANIAAATAAEVVAKITASAAGFTASVGAGSDFFLVGGDGTTEGAGRILVAGRMTLIERGLRYTEQPLFQNTALAAGWGVDPVGPIPTPTINTVQTVFLDVWHREVSPDEDSELVDSRIGIETAVSVRREWAVRVVAAATFPAVLAARPAGHAYYPLAELHRGANNAGIADSMVVDVRDTDASLRPEVAYRNAAGMVVVDTERFRNALILTRDAARGFVTYLTTQFVAPSSGYLAAEILATEALSAIAAAADQGLGVVNAQALGTRGALGVMRQLYDAEARFVTVWQASVLPLVKSGATPYQAAFGASVILINSYLDGPAPGGNVAVTSALAAANLDGAVTSQERIAAELGAQAGKPTGTLAVKYLGSVTPTVLAGSPLDLEFEVSGAVTPDDDLVVQVFIDGAWAVSLKNGDGSTPFALEGGPGVFSRHFFVTVTPPAGPASTLFNVEVHALHNPALSLITTQKTLQIGSAPPPSEGQYEIKVATASVMPSGGVYQVPRSTTADVTFVVANHTNAAVTIDLDPSPGAAGWTVAKGPFALTNHSVAAFGNSTDFLWHFTAPGSGGVALSFTLKARDHANPATLLAEATISLVST